MKTKAVYAGSFDPVTIGHLYIINVGFHLFDELVIAVGNNTQKKHTFSIHERIDMVAKVVNEHIISNINDKPIDCSIVQMENCFLNDFAIDIRANFILRGIRPGDYEYERRMAEFNKPVKTIWIPTPSHLADISSSFVKSMCGLKNWEEKASKMVSPFVLAKLKDKLDKNV